MSNTDMSRRGLLKTSFLGAAAAGVTGLTATAAKAEPAQAADAEYDVIVVGAGPAGLITAITAHDLGAKVALFEKRDRPDGNAIFALGSICGWGTRHQKEQGIEDTADAFYAMMMDVSKQMGDKALNRTYTDNISEGIDWLESEIGVKFGKIRPMPYPRLGRTCRVLGDGITGGARLVQYLLAAAKKRGIEIKYEHKVIELIHDEKFAVQGVVALTDDGRKRFLSRGGVCITTGGFSANPEMVDRYIGGWATRMVLRGSKSTTGENISLTLPLYTKFVNMDQFHSGPIIGVTHVNPADVLNSGYGVQVNTSGNRFMDENNTYVVKARTTALQTVDNQAWVIVDSDCSVLDKVIPKFDRLHSPYGKADTIEELCKQVNLPVKNVQKAVDAYNKALAENKLDEMTPPNTYKKPHPIAKAPFYAVPFQGGMTATFGGPLINTRAEIQNLDGASIPGLYAAGNAAGGIFYFNYAGGAQLGAATVFGRIAAREMAARAKKAK
ncbi:FAD-dependent oxidoreductase [Sutterella sp.]|uniref:FAD-dependent oxidoreductase n=1 Tax=Sutterella sp. TaxID=1981025 RepID=UPI0026DF75BB|nr:FAD-dependent oxidoreductase [Sutterella sp.]MDO5530990.1 FAD-dependent oxidoreductase [Sutterella sp.]